MGSAARSLRSFRGGVVGRNRIEPAERRGLLLPVIPPEVPSGVEYVSDEEGGRGERRRGRPGDGPEVSASQVVVFGGSLSEIGGSRPSMDRLNSGTVRVMSVSKSVLALARSCSICWSTAIDWSVGR